MSKLIVLMATLLIGGGWSSHAFSKPTGKKTGQVSKAKKKSRVAGKKREKHIVREQVKRGSTSVNFEDVDIEGQAKTPMGDIVKSNRGKKGYDFVKVRTRWHPEMIRSVTSLGSAGSGRK